ncbi:hypothetical protein [Microbulbifer litoralis]|uniref:hypothetical protein n=1 Tax=Microbulbifer litoralis TaxID=2933965 RepID=UPI00202841EF|nr:hypothetical protein [Microbulbifer sp. GX H0434]
MKAVLGKLSTIRSFTAKDICAALGGISRSRLHVWAHLPPFSERPTRERSARRFTKADLLTFAVLQTLEDTFGAKGRDLGRASGAIHKYLSAPRQAPAEEMVFIPLKSGEAHWVQVQSITCQGWIVDMAKERERIDIFLGAEPSQKELHLIADIKSGRK